MVKEKTLKKLGGGCFSLTFLLHLKNKEYVLKCPSQKGRFSHKRWFFHIQKEILFLKEYVPRQRQIVLPKIIEVSDDYIIQKKIEGVPLTEELYERLSLSEQKNIVKQLAFFFFKLHQKTAQDISVNSPKGMFLRGIQKFFDKDELYLYKTYRLLLKKNPQSYVYSCLCISDFKSSHILYNLKTKKMGLIDFGSIHYSVPESEFILKNPIRSRLSLRMLKDIVSIYNRLQKGDIISWERLKSHLILYALKEVYTPYLNKEILPREKERLRKILYEFVEKVEQL